MRRGLAAAVGAGCEKHGIFFLWAPSRNDLSLPTALLKGLCTIEGKPVFDSGFDSHSSLPYRHTWYTKYDKKNENSFRAGGGGLSCVRAAACLLCIRRQLFNTAIVTRYIAILVSVSYIRVYSSTRRFAQEGKVQHIMRSGQSSMID